jgi:hypothetical protein
MCRTITLIEERVSCSRCGKTANPTDGWEHGWPLYGYIHLGFPAQAFVALRCGPPCGDESDFEWWEKGHPAMIQNDAQEVKFQWGNGMTYDSVGRYRLCYDCQKALLGVIGTFFGIPKQER